MNVKPMKFLLLPKEGKPRFSSKDPWEYIKSKGLRVIEDWIGFTEDLGGLNASFFKAVEIENTEGLKLSLVFLSPTGEKTRDSDSNNNAEIFCRAYCDYIDNVKENLVILLKDYKSKDNSFNPFTTREVNSVRRMLQSAFKWFS